MADPKKSTIPPTALSKQPPARAPADKPGAAAPDTADAAVTFDPDCLLEPGPCSVCAGRTTLVNPAWDAWRQNKRAIEERNLVALETGERQETLPLPPNMQEETICPACDGLGRQLSRVGQRVRDILRPHLLPAQRLPRVITVAQQQATARQEADGITRSASMLAV